MLPIQGLHNLYFYIIITFYSVRLSRVQIKTFENAEFLFFFKSKIFMKNAIYY